MSYRQFLLDMIKNSEHLQSTSINPEDRIYWLADKNARMSDLKALDKYLKCKQPIGDSDERSS